MLDALEDLFSRIDAKLGQLKTDISNSTYESILVKRENDDLLKADEFRQACKTLLKEIHDNQDRDLNKYSNSPNDTIEKSVYFIPGKQNINACDLAGRVRVVHDLISRVQFANFWPRQLTVELPKPKTDRFNMCSQKSFISPDLILPHSVERIVYAHSVTPGHYELEIHNGQTNEFQEYLHETGHPIDSLRLELCQVDYELDRIILYLENRLVILFLISKLGIEDF